MTDISIIVVDNVIILTVSLLAVFTVMYSFDSIIQFFAKAFNMKED